MPYYSAFELNIISDLAFPELLPGYPLAPANCQIRITRGLDGLSSPTKKGVTYQVSRGQFWLSVPNIGRFLVVEGKTIAVEPDKLVDEASLRLFILGPCLSALLIQQQKYVLNGDVVSTGEQACAIIGHAGAGKSVLTQALIAKDHKLLSSGLCVIDSSNRVLPGYPRIQLWSDALKLLSLEKVESRLRPCLEKWSVPVDTNFCHTSLPLQSIYLLSTHHQSEMMLTPLHGFSKFNQLRTHTAHQAALEHLVDIRQYQLQGTFVANQARITKIMRPDIGDTVKALVEIISRDLHSQGLTNEH